MTYRHNVLSTIDRPLEPDAKPGVHEQSPSWLLAVVRLSRPLSFDRRTSRSNGSAIDGAFSRAARPLIIDSDCTSLTVSCSKASHTKTLQATLKFTHTDYLRADKILPSDWLFAWMFDNTHDAARVAKAVYNGEPANGFHDGLKFVGRVHSLFRDLSTNGSEKSVSYSLVGIGFAELDTQLFYDWNLANSVDQNIKSDFAQFMGELGVTFDKFATQEELRSSSRAVNNSQRLLAALVDIIVGQGISRNVNEPINDRVKAMSGPTQEVHNSVSGNSVDATGLYDAKAPQGTAEAPYSYLVPKTVGRLLGRPDNLASKEAGSIFAYADILETVMGVQSYVTSGKNLGVTSFSPVLDERKSTVSRKFCTSPLLGSFSPQVPNFVNTPLWSVLSQYVNPAVNEMYTALRTNQHGQVVPTLVARQIPFTTRQFQNTVRHYKQDYGDTSVKLTEEKVEVPVTRYLDLPRWVLPPVLLSRVSVGRSDAMRCNMVHVYGAETVRATGMDQSTQLVLNPPIFDKLDIMRNGVRGIMQTVNSSVADLELGAPKIWAELVADRAIGAQFTLSGSVTSKLIQAPIAEGDNAEIQGVIFHIEHVEHSGRVQTDGRKTATTTLRLSNGLEDDSEDPDPVAPLYPGFRYVHGAGGRFVESETYKSEPETFSVDGRDAEANPLLQDDPGHGGVSGSHYHDEDE